MRENKEKSRDISRLNESLHTSLKIQKKLGYGTSSCQGEIGKIGEIYAWNLKDKSWFAKPGQPGYDLYLPDRRTLSVKATASSGSTRIGINANTCKLADLTMVIAYDDNLNPEVIYYGPTEFLISHCSLDTYNNEHRITRDDAREAYQTLLKV